MVTFRFYVVSLVAFFLALAVGVLVGSVLDGRIADGLQARLASVERSLDETVAAIDAKNVEIEQFERYVEASAPYAVQDRLASTSAVVVAEDGVDAGAVEDLVLRLRQAGSDVAGILWLEARWDLLEADDLAAAAELAGIDSEDPAEIRAALWDQLLVAATPEPESTTTTTSPGAPVPGSSPPGTGATTTPPSTTTTPPTTITTEAPDDSLLAERPPLSGAIEAGLVRFQRIDGESGTQGGEPLVVAVTGTASALSDPGALTAELAGRSSAAGVRTVLAEVGEPPEEGAPVERGLLVAEALAEGPVEFSTVDNMELIAGRVAVVLALADLTEGAVGRFGYGPDVDDVLPPWPGP